MKTKNIIITAVLGLILFSFTGCSLLKKRVEKKETVKYTLNGNTKTSIHIENTNGRINISNSNDTNGSIRIEAEIIADVKADEQDKPIDNVKILIDSTGNEIKIETEINNSNSGMFRKNKNAEVNYDIKVPQNMKVYTETVNGTTTITRINNDIKAETINGQINVYNCPGRIDIEGVNGSVTCNVDSITAGINISIVNGDVKIGGLKNVDADVNASTVNGKVKFKDLSFTDVNSEKRTLSGVLGKGGSMIRIECTNGKISLDAAKILSKKDDSFEFKIDFDDMDDPIRVIDNDSNEEIGKEPIEPPKAPVKTDSIKK